MIRPTVRLRRALPLALVAVLVLAAPAAAHPFIEGGEAPVDSLASLTLDLAHGCSADGGDEHDAAEEPTTEVALEVHEQLRIVEVPDVDGFDVELETDEDGWVEVVTWLATTSTAPAPELPFDAVVSGDPGDELYLRVFQACGDLDHRWVGTPDQPAEDPAIRLTLADADPDRPAPDPEPVPTGDSANAASDEAGDEASGEETADAGEGAGEDPATGEEPAADPAGDPAEEAGAAPEREELAVAPPAAPQDSPLLWAIVILAGALLLIALILALRPRPAAAAAPDGLATGDDGAGADETETS